jgi:hypothetical protein
MGHDDVNADAHSIAGPQPDLAHVEASAVPADMASTTTTIVAMAPRRFKIPPVLLVRT